MKKEKLKYLCSKTFRNYLFSYIGIFFMTLSLLTIVAVWHITENTKAEGIRLAESKLYTIVEDMEIQMKAMRGMVVDIATRQEFHLDYFCSNKYLEKEMVNRLADYVQVSDICEYYFLKYDVSDTVFTSVGTSMPLRVLLSEKFGEKDYTEVQALIESSCVVAEERVLFCKLGDTMLFIYPVKKYTVSGSGRESVLCFQVSEDGLKERIQKIVGIMDGELTLYYKEFCILGEEIVSEGGVREYDNTLELTSHAGNFKAYFCMNENSYVTWNNLFSGQEIILFVSIFVLLLFLGIFIAYCNFRPMRKIAEKYRATAEEGLAADWDSIDAFIESLLRGKERNGKMLQEQFQLFREKTIQLIASGGYSEKVQEYMTLLNIKLDGPVFGMIKCSLSDMQKPAAEYLEFMNSDVEELSDDGAFLYTYWDRDENLGVLAAVEEEYQLEEIVELLQSLFETKSLSAKVDIIGVSRDLKALNSNSAEKDIQGDKSEEKLPEGEAAYGLLEKDKDAGKVSGKQNSTARLVLEYIKENYTNYDLSLDLIAQEFQITSTYLSRIIKQETGMNYKDYLTGLRIDEAKRLLLDHKVSVIDACIGSGYNNVSYFIKVFQKCTGVTPAKYRDEH